MAGKAEFPLKYEGYGDVRVVLLPWLLYNYSYLVSLSVDNKYNYIHKPISLNIDIKLLTNILLAM